MAVLLCITGCWLTTVPGAVPAGATPLQFWTVAPATVATDDGTVHVLYRDRSGGLRHVWTADGLAYGSERLDAHTTLEPAVTAFGQRLDVVYRDPAGTLHHRRFEGGWSEDEAIDATSDGLPAAVTEPSGQVDVFYRSGETVHRSTLSHDGSWHHEDLAIATTIDPVAVAAGVDGLGVVTDAQGLYGYPTLQLSQFDGTRWRTHVIGGHGGRPALAQMDDGGFAMAYWGGDGGVLARIHHAGAGWTGRRCVTGGEGFSKPAVIGYGSDALVVMVKLYVWSAPHTVYRMAARTLVGNASVHSVAPDLRGAPAVARAAAPGSFLVFYRGTGDRLIAQSLDPAGDFGPPAAVSAGFAP